MRQFIRTLVYNPANKFIFATLLILGLATTALWPGAVPEWLPWTHIAVSLLCLVYGTSVIFGLKWIEKTGNNRLNKSLKKAPLSGAPKKEGFLRTALVVLAILPLRLLFVVVSLGYFLHALHAFLPALFTPGQINELSASLVTPLRHTYTPIADFVDRWIGGFVFPIKYQMIVSETVLGAALIAFCHFIIVSVIGGAYANLSRLIFYREAWEATRDGLINRRIVEVDHRRAEAASARGKDNGSA